jgi:hypothetical protein
MSLLESSQFRVSVRSKTPSVSVLYKPTRRRYTYTAIVNRIGTSPEGVLAAGFCVERAGHFVNYDDSEIQRHARRLASARAKKIFRDS